MERILHALLGLLLFGESLGLLFGVVLPGTGEGTSPWAVPKNLLLLGLDALTGLVLLLVALRLGPFMSPLIVACLLGLGLLTHALREGEFWLGGEVPFCFNRSLEWMNLSKLALISLALLWNDLVGESFD